MELYIHEATEKEISVVNIAYPEYRHTFKDIEVTLEGVTAVHSVERSMEDGKYNGDDEEQFLEDQGTEILNELIKIIDRESKVA